MPKRATSARALLLALAMGAALSGPATRARAEDPDLAAITSLGAHDPDAALLAVERLVAARPDLRLAGGRLRARLLAATGRADLARAELEALAATGAPVARDLLDLAGARLEVAPPAWPAPGAPAALALDGARTGPLELRLYRVDARRLRAALAQDPARGLLGHLRAPPPGAARRVAAWRAEPLDGPRALETPVPLEPGPHLLTIGVRGVVVPVPLLVTHARPLARRLAGPGALALVDARTGALVAPEAAVACDLEGRPLPPDDAPPLDAAEDGPARDDAPDRAAPTLALEGGLVRFTGAPSAALLWLAPDLPLLCPLPGPLPAPPLPAPTLALDLARASAPAAPGPDAARPEVRLALAPLRGGAGAALRLVDARGVALALGRARADRFGVLRGGLAIPPGAAPGALALEVAPDDGGPAPAPAAFELAPPALPALLRLEAPPAAPAGEPLRAVLSARWRDGRPLAGATVRWALAPWSARDPLTARGSPPAEGPLPRWALRRDGDGPGAPAAEGALALDARGEALLAVRAPTGLGLSALTATLELAPGHALVARADVAHGPADLRLAVAPARDATSTDAAVDVRVVAAHLDGRPAALADLALALVRPEGGVEATFALRTGPDGVATTAVHPDAPGRWGLALSGRDASGRAVSAAATLEVARARAPAAAGAAPGDAPRLVLEAPAAGGAPARVLVLFPVSGRDASPPGALVTDEGAGVLGARWVPLAGGLARVEPGPGAERVVALAWQGGAPREVALDLVRPSEALDVAAAPAPAAAGGPPGPALRLDVRVDLAGAGRSASVAGAVYDPTAALEQAHAEPGGAPLGPPATGTRRRDAAPPPGARLGPEVASTTNGRGLGGLAFAEAPAGPAWARVEARDAQGRRGVGWAALGAAPALEAEAAGPAWLVEDDRAEVALVVACRAPEALAALRVAWRAHGVELKTPRVAGARPLLAGDPGAAAVRLEPGRLVRLVWPVVAQDPRALAGEARVDFTLEAEPAAGAPAAPAPLLRRWRADLRPRGVVERRAWSGRLTLDPGSPAAAATLDLDLPDGVGAGALTVAVDPTPLTAALAGARALDPDADPVRGPVCAYAAARVVEAALRARGLAPPGAAAPAPPDPGEVTAGLAAALGADGGWGPRSVDVALALLALDLADSAPGEAPGDAPGDAREAPLRGLRARALDACERGRPTDPVEAARRLWALAQAGRLAHAREVPDPAAAPPDARPFLASALDALARAGSAEAAARAEEAVAAAVVGRAALARPDAVARLFALLARRGEAPAARAALADALLAARAGASWPDPGDALAAVEALCAVAAEPPSLGVTARLEAASLVDAWSGGGLAAWTGAGRTERGVVRRARLALGLALPEGQAAPPGPPPAAAWSALAEVLVRVELARREPAQGAQLTRRLELLDGRPVGHAVATGTPVRLVIEGAPGAAAPPAGLVLELPLPGGCALLEASAGAVRASGGLRTAWDGGRLECLLLAVTPGAYRLAAARAFDPRALEARAASGEAVLRIE